MKIGIGITTHNRLNVAENTVSNIKKYAPKNAKIVIVDDASRVPFPNSTYRFNVNVGISVAKNKCLELLDDCDYIFLFDDDCYPKVKDWHLPYIESGINHMSFTFSKLANGRANGNNFLSKNKNLVSYANPCGCMLFFTKKCLETVGGFDEAFDTYSFEHVELSNRIFNAKLTPWRFIDVENSLDLFTSLDYESSIESSVNDKSIYRNNNKLHYKRVYGSSEFKPYKNDGIKEKHGNVVITAYFNYSFDPQRGKKWASNTDDIKRLMESCEERGVKLYVFTDCIPSSHDTDLVKFIRTKPSMSHSPNVYRWIVYQEWMKKNTFDKAWFVDSTDVELLKDPFKKVKEGRLYVGNECDVKTDNVWMRTKQEKYLRIPDYRKVIASFASETLINCGLVGGTYDVLDALINKWAGMHKRHTVGIHHSTDMAIFNYVVRKFFNEILESGDHINTRFKYNETDNKKAIWKHK